MSDFKLTLDHDLDLSTNDIQFVTGGDAVVQHQLIRLRFFKGEWFYDQRVGIPYYTKILVKNPSLVAVNGIFRTAIQTTPGTDALNRIDFNYDAGARRLQVNYSCNVAGEEVARDVSGVFIT